MRILFFLPTTSLVRHFDSVLLALANRGHAIRIATPGQETNWPLPEALAAHGRVSEVVCPAGRSDEWAGAARLFRLFVDYHRYLAPAFAGADKLRERARAEFIAALAGGRIRRLAARCPACNAKVLNDAVARLLLPDGGPAAERLRHLLTAIERAIPPDPLYQQFLRSEQPDAVLVSPLVGLGSEQTDWVKGARALGIPVGFPVFSWDNLTTKGIVHEQPDQVFVWNDIQKREAMEHHGVPAARVVVTGAPRFDAFLDLAPKRDRQTFCAKYALDPDKPIVAYLCSSDFVADAEAAFVWQWIAEVRREPVLAECNVVIRPHPRSEHQWTQADPGAWPRVAVVRPKSMNADRSLYETLFHSAVVVGLNTSAQIEAALLEKPVLTLLAPGFERGQQGTLHFRYLLEEEGGFVRVAEDFAAHRRHLVDAVQGRYDRAALRAFSTRFVRPAGLDRPATPLLADAIERLRPSGSFAAVKQWLRPARSRNDGRGARDASEGAVESLRALGHCADRIDVDGAAAPQACAGAVDRVARTMSAGDRPHASAACPSCGTDLTASELAALVRAAVGPGLENVRALLRVAEAAMGGGAAGSALTPQAAVKA